MTDTTPPRTISQMTNEEVGALVKAHNDGEKIQAFFKEPAQWARIMDPMWFGNTAYRIKPTRADASQKAIIDALTDAVNALEQPHCRWVNREDVLGIIASLGMGEA